MRKSKGVIHIVYHSLVAFGESYFLHNLSFKAAQNPFQAASHNLTSQATDAS